MGHQRGHFLNYHLGARQLFAQRGLLSLRKRKRCARTVPRSFRSAVQRQKVAYANGLLLLTHCQLRKKDRFALQRRFDVARTA